MRITPRGEAKNKHTKKTNLDGRWNLSKPKVRSVLIKSINQSIPDNPRILLLDKKRFGTLQLFQKRKLKLNDPDDKFGKEFLPKMLKLLRTCWTLVRYQVLCWRYPLLRDIVRPIKGGLKDTLEHKLSEW